LLKITVARMPPPIPASMLSSRYVSLAICSPPRL
jgi:hypothetical protein